MNTRSGRGFDSRQVHKIRARGRNGVTPALHAGDDGFNSRVVHDLRKRCLAVHSLIHREQMLKATAKRLRTSTQKRIKNLEQPWWRSGICRGLRIPGRNPYRFKSCLRSRFLSEIGQFCRNAVSCRIRSGRERLG